MEEEKIELLSSVEALKVDMRERHKNEWDYYKIKNEKEEIDR